MKILFRACLTKTERVMYHKVCVKCYSYLEHAHSVDHGLLDRQLAVNIK